VLIYWRQLADKLIFQWHRIPTRAKDVTQRYAMPKLMAIIPNELAKSGGGGAAVSFYECVIRKRETCQKDVMPQKPEKSTLSSSFFKIKHATHPNPGQIKNTILAQRESEREREERAAKKKKERARRPG